MFMEGDDMDGPRCHAISGGAKACKVLGRRGGVKEIAEKDQFSDDNLYFKQTSSPASSDGRAKGIFALLVFLVSTVSSFAQESLRTPLLRPAYAGFRPVTGSFLRIGPFGGTLTGGVGAGFNDNYFTSDTNKVSDFYTFQELNFDLSWVISRLNRIDFKLGAQLEQDFLSNGASGMHLSLSPETNLQFQFQIADLRFLVYDRFSYANDPVSDPAVSGTGNLNRLANTAGITVDWILHNATVEVGFLHTYTDQSSAGSIVTSANNVSAVSGERQDFRIPASIIFNFSPTVFYGVDATAIKSTAPGFSDANAINVGGFVRGRITRLVDVELHAGAYFIDAGSVPPVDWDLTVTLRDQINRDLQAYASFVRDIRFGVGNDLSELNTFYFGASYNLTRNWTVSGQPFVNFGHQFGTGGEHFNQYGVQAETDLKLSKRWMGQISYRWVQRNSNVADRSYTQNQIFCSLNYAF
jgi:hypothetical protein